MVLFKHPTLGLKNNINGTKQKKIKEISHKVYKKKVHL